jgi:tetratricopeptide (TPR) repeat protein
VLGCAPAQKPGEAISIRNETEYQVANREARELLQDRLPKLAQGNETKATKEDRTKFLDALSRYEGMIAFAPRGFASYFAAGTVRWALGDYEGAIVRMTEFLKTAPELPGPEIQVMIADAHQVIAMCCFEQKDFVQAEAAITESIKRFPDIPEYLSLRASIRIQQQNREGALEDLKRALKVDPNHSRTRQMMKMLEIESSG